MTKVTSRVSLAIGILLLAILACQPGTAPAPATSSPIAGLADTLTAAAPPPASHTPTDSLAAPIVFMETASPTFTLEAASLTVVPPTDTLVPSPTIPLVSVSAATNCRTGPGREYDRVFVVDVGTVYEVTGRYTPDNYWIVRLPGGGQCWLWGQYATLAGDVNSLPEMVPPPTPTPAAGSVMGTVTDQLTGKKLSNVVVTGLFSRSTISTSLDGTYFIGNLPSGQEFITVEDSNHRAAFQAVHISPGNPVVADFALSPEFIINLGSTVEGTVFLSSSPAAGVSVSVWSRNASAVTDSNGHFRIEFQAKAYTTSYLITAELGNLRGAAVVDISTSSIAPDIILLPR